MSQQPTDHPDYAEAFGRHLRRLREEVFHESIRQFAARINLSSSYLGRIELGQVGIPRRQTILNIAASLPSVDPAMLLIKAGYSSPLADLTEADEVIVMKLDRIDPAHRRLVEEYIDFLATVHPRPV